MTAPDATLPDQQRYEWPVTYAVDGLVFGDYDRWGNFWHVESTEGWHEPAGPRTNRQARADGHGDSRTPAWRDARVITLKGQVLAPNIGARLKARDAYGALCSDPATLYEFVGVDQVGERRTAMVELDDRPRFAAKHERLAEYQLQLAAPDPRKHGSWQEPRLGRLTAPIGGLDYSTGAGYPLSYGTPGLPLQAKVANYGTAPAAPLLTIVGGLTRPSLVHIESGRAFTSVGDVAAGEIVWINCDDHPAKGVPGHGRRSSVRGDVSTLWPMSSGWPSIAPGEVATFELRADGAPVDDSRVSLRSAFWA